MLRPLRHIPSALALLCACDSGRLSNMPSKPEPPAEQPATDGDDDGDSPGTTAPTGPQRPARDADTLEPNPGEGSANADAAPPPPPRTDAPMPSTDDPPTSPADDWRCTFAEIAGVDPLPPANARTARLIQGGFDFLEGPVWFHAQQRLFFSDMLTNSNAGDGPISTIHQLAGEDVSVFIERANSNGLAVAADGRLLAATHDAQTLSLFTLDSKARETLDLRYQGDKFNSPNDIAVRSDGTLYFTDPDWQLPPRTSETGITGVYRVSPAGQVSLVEGALPKPNGITLSPDERVLYVSAYDGTIYRYDVAEDGSTDNRRAFAGVSSDGMAVDCAGNLYATADGVQVFSPDGELFGAISVAETTTNVAFGGEGRRTLYITAGTGLYAIELKLPGSPF